MGGTGIRPAGLIRQEISDLTEYLDGVPEALRASGALQAYEARLADLQDELLLSSLVESLPRVPMDRASALTPLSSPPLAEALLGAAQSRLERRLKSQAKLRATLNFAGILASAVSGILAYLLPRTDVPPIAVVAAAAVAFTAMLASLVYAPVGSALEYQRAIVRLTSVRTYLSVSAEGEPDPEMRTRYLSSILAEMEAGSADAALPGADRALQREQVP